MFCKFCGASVDDNSMYCLVCGKNISGCTSNDHGYSDENHTGTNNIPKGICMGGYEYNPSVYIVQAIAEAVLIICSICFFCASMMEPLDSDLFDIFERDQLKIGSAIFMCISIIGFLYSIVLYNRTKGIYYNIYDNRIQGRGLVKELSFSQSDFDFAYQDITNVAVQARCVLITSNNTTYRILARDYYEASRVEDIIINMKRVSANASSTSDEWVCSNCGRNNQSYVGTCACGKTKK